MATYRIVDVEQLDADMTSVANAIRNKGGTIEKLVWPSGFIAAIESITASSSDNTTAELGRAILGKMKLA